MKTSFLILTLSLTFLTPSWAQWPSSVLERFKNDPTPHQQLENPAVATFWGGFRRFRWLTHNDGEVLQLESRHFKAKKYEIYLSSQQRPAPLYVFMPGIYGQPNQGLTPQMIDVLEGLGVHVLVIPNLLAPSYIESHPLYGQDPIELEVSVLNETLDFSLKKLDGLVTGVHVLAESLGTAMGAAWVAHDSQKQKRIKSLTLLWPPLFLPVAMKNFDAIINEHRPAARECPLYTKLWVVTREFVLKDWPSSLTAEEEKCLGAMVLVDGFVTATKRSWKAHAEVVGLRGEGPDGFEAFFRNYRSVLWELLEKKDERLKLAHWMKIIKQDPQFKLRIMTSQNDFLNRGLDWEGFKREMNLSDKEVLILSWGGHSGPIGMPGFDQILRESLTR